MFSWIKKGLLFNPNNFPNRPSWMFEFAQAPCVLPFHDHARIYFCCRPKPDENGQYVSYSAYVDVERNDLFRIIKISPRPLLPLGDLGTFDEFGTYPFSVVRTNDEIVFAYYGGWTRCESVPFDVAIGLCSSSDNGETFSKHGSGPILSYSPDEPFILSGPKIRKYGDQYFLFYIAGKEWILAEGKPEPVYKIRMATSADGYVWKKHGCNLIEDVLGSNEAQASPDVIFRNGKYHMFFCYRQGVDYRKNSNNSYRIGYAHSLDLIKWIRDDKNAGLDVSTDGFDSQMVAYPHVFELDGRILMLYLGNDVGRYGFGLAELDGDLS